MFNPNRHDFGDKNFLGTTIKGSGIEEVARRIAILAVEPATAHFVSTQAGAIFLLRRAVGRSWSMPWPRPWKRSDGDIAAVLRTLFAIAGIQGLAGQQVQGPDALCRVGACAPPMATR